MKKQLQISAAVLIIFGILVKALGLITACYTLLFGGIAIVVTWFVIILIRAMVAMGHMIFDDTDNQPWEGETNE